MVYGKLNRRIENCRVEEWGGMEEDVKSDSMLLSSRGRSLKICGFPLRLHRERREPAL